MSQITDECRELIHSLLTEVDGCIIDDIRQEAEEARRLQLLYELDVLERVQVRLNARLDD
jgi:hypothetical protein